MLQCKNTLSRHEHALCMNSSYEPWQKTQGAIEVTEQRLFHAGLIPKAGIPADPPHKIINATTAKTSFGKEANNGFGGFSFVAPPVANQSLSRPVRVPSRLRRPAARGCSSEICLSSRRRLASNCCNSSSRSSMRLRLAACSSRFCC